MKHPPRANLSNNSVADYYKYSQWLYQLFCYTQRSLGMHYGFWEHNTKSVTQAQLNENQAIIDLSGITKQSSVLDVGCGVGGTALYIAEKTHAKVTGITIEQNQVKKARQLAHNKNLAHLCTFYQQDFMNLENYEENSFDVVYAVESTVYAHPKHRFLKQIYRVLKPTGRIVVADGFARTLPKDKTEQKVLDGITWGFKLAPMVTIETFRKELSTAGFVDITIQDKTLATSKSVFYFDKIARLFFPIARLLNRLPNPYLKSLMLNATALHNVANSYRLGIGMYALVCAKKPVV